MKIRFIEEHDPIRGTTVYYTEKTVLGLWWGSLSMVSNSCSYQYEEARRRWERFKTYRSTKPICRILETIKL